MLGEYMRRYLREKKNKLVRVMMTVVRMVVVNVVDRVVGSSTREEVRGPCATTRRGPAATRKRRRRLLAGMVGGREEEEEKSTEERHVLGRKSRGKGQENQT